MQRINGYAGGMTTWPFGIFRADTTALMTKANGLTPASGDRVTIASFTTLTILFDSPVRLNAGAGSLLLKNF